MSFAPCEQTPPREASQALGRESDDNTVFIHDLKLRLTAISGYAQLLERQIQQSEHATDRQREYIVRLRRVIDDLALTIREHEAEQKSRSEQENPGNGNGSTRRRNSDCMSY
jgi:signal transduction histidine kinase